MKKILVIDDEKYLNRLVQFNLSDEGYKVVTVLDGRSGLEVLAEQDIGLVILDLAMPGMDGFEVLKEMKSDDRWKSIPVIILTAKIMEEVEREALALGASVFLTKPFSPDALIEIIRKELN